MLICSDFPEEQWPDVISRWGTCVLVALIDLSGLIKPSKYEYDVNKGNTRVGIILTYGNAYKNKKENN